MIHQRELEWNERQKKKLEKQRKRKVDESVEDAWNNDVRFYDAGDETVLVCTVG